MLEPRVSGAYRDSHLLSGRKQAVKPLTSAREKPSWRLAWEGLDTGYPSDVCQTGDESSLTRQHP